MTYLFMLVTLICGAILQAVFPTWAGFGQAHAPILLGLVLYYSLTHERALMLQTAVLAGLLQDALGMIPLGYSSFCFCVVALIAGKYKETVFSREMITHVFFGGLASGGVTLTLYLLLGKDDLVILRPLWALLKIVGSMILGMVIIPLEFKLLEALDRMLGNITPRESS